ncbi:MAG: glutamate synthase subunit alpha, partial [Alphaproteobacteria bacterium]
MKAPSRQGLYDPGNEHDSCGVGFVADIKGRKSHDIIRDGLQILANLDHRGAVGDDPLMGDGAGCLIQIPDRLLRDWATKAGHDLPQAGHYAVAMCFLPRNEAAREASIATLERYTSAEGQPILAWRDVPTDITGLGARVIETMPVIRQAILGRNPRIKDQDEFERKILTIRKQTLNSARAQATDGDLDGIEDFFISSFSSRTVVYKCLLLSPQVENFYCDLRDPLAQSALALVHQRFSTNTFPSWQLAHP